MTKRSLDAQMTKEGARIFSRGAGFVVRNVPSPPCYHTRPLPQGEGRVRAVSPVRAKIHHAGLPKSDFVIPHSCFVICMASAPDQKHSAVVVSPKQLLGSHGPLSQELYRSAYAAERKARFFE